MVLLLLPSTTAAKPSIHYVLADGGDDCPTDKECHPLSFYTNDFYSYFTDNAVFYFMKGNHLMSKNILFRGKYDITMKGVKKNVSIINCSHFAVFILECSDITISDLSITNYIMTSSNNFSAALNVKNSSRIYFHSLIIVNNNASSLKIRDSTKLIVNGSTFIYKSSNTSNVDETVDIAFTEYICMQTSCDELFNVSLQIVNCTIQGGYYGLSMKFDQQSSYMTEVLLKEIDISNCIHGNAILNLGKSLYNININKLYSHDALIGLMVLQIQSVRIMNSSNVSAYIPSNPLVITSSSFYNNNVGIQFSLSQSMFNNIEQTITLKFCKIYNNTGTEGMGFIIFHRNYIFRLTTTKVLIENTIMANNTKSQITGYDGLTFNNVSIYGSTSTGLILISSTIIMEKTVTIYNNTGTSGGGIALYDRSEIVLMSDSNLLIYNNFASNRGGGIFNDFAFP
jgi:hypothetical protein